MKSDEEIMEILEAFDLTRSYRAAAEVEAVAHSDAGAVEAELTRVARQALGRGADLLALGAEA